jgi:hypothetical protein
MEHPDPEQRIALKVEGAPGQLGLARLQGGLVPPGSILFDEERGAPGKHLLQRLAAVPIVLSKGSAQSRVAIGEDLEGMAESRGVQGPSHPQRSRKDIGA